MLQWASHMPINFSISWLWSGHLWLHHLRSDGAHHSDAVWIPHTVFFQTTPHHATFRRNPGCVITTIMSGLLVEMASSVVFFHWGSRNWTLSCVCLLQFCDLDGLRLAHLKFPPPWHCWTQSRRCGASTITSTPVPRTRGSTHWRTLCPSISVSSSLWWQAWFYSSSGENTEYVGCGTLTMKHLSDWMERDMHT